MHHHYSDIRDKLGEPQWWDEYAVPRYCDFGPRQAAYIYARQIVLLLIECQNCGTEFKVCMTSGDLDKKSLEELVQADEIHYGDPPHTQCCPAGPTMNSVPRRVLEFWDSYDDEGGYIWDARRRPDLERGIECEWADA